MALRTGGDDWECVAQVRVSRKRILESASKVMELYCSGRALLELEFFGEVGTGLGPTLEFYTLLAYELQRKALGMWRCEAGGSRSAGGAPPFAIKAEAGIVIRGSDSGAASPKVLPIQVSLLARVSEYMIDGRLIGFVHCTNDYHLCSIICCEGSLRGKCIARSSVPFDTVVARMLINVVSVLCRRVTWWRVRRRAPLWRRLRASSRRHCTTSARQRGR